ncbi:ribbon-helix-helix protein, CopG family [Paraburkholderia sp. SARCC-3016]|uniref:ribbon-helix-helix protein, CopG family n=1 Tax=Paraburkholderia sp. SARCC-3016 TaxID=3058611 RepID=UPI0028079E3F|nr:ribbon-helix-helix protein, CopG family [Paraburkholderia sp. SARCC-3016]MDQ7982170.1 ribbon-helix-helix protein, CopG family [Paraburkholderia sp. SARCC-3016]
MAHGKYLGVDTRPLNVRIDVEDLDILKKLQIVTGRNTSDVVRTALKTYIATNRHKLVEAGQQMIKSGGGWEGMAQEEWGDANESK